jgi:hypothetical protein
MPVGAVCAALAILDCVTPSTPRFVRDLGSVRYHVEALPCRRAGVGDFRG